LRDLQKCGNAGEFYTPRPVTQFLVEMIKPKLGETVLDPACGTGGFLINVIDYIIAHSKVKSLADREKLQNSIRGIEKEAPSSPVIHN
jgi:type I restriction enzyme M protein